MKKLFIIIIFIASIFFMVGYNNTKKYDKNNYDKFKDYLIDNGYKYNESDSTYVKKENKNSKYVFDTVRREFSYIIDLGNYDMEKSTFNFDVNMSTYTYSSKGYIVNAKYFHKEKQFLCSSTPDTLCYHKELNVVAAYNKLVDYLLENNYTFKDLSD